MKKNQSQKQDAKAQVNARQVMAKALEAEKLDEAARKVVSLAKARFKAARKALKVAKKAAKKARKEAKVAAKERKKNAQKVGRQPARKPSGAKALKMQVAKAGSASSGSLPDKSSLDPSLVTTVIHSGILPAITTM